jgi:hypothetical protein
MRKLMGCLVAIALVALPQVALAQRARAASSAKNEIGVDFGAAYNHQGSGCTADCGSFIAGTPVDVRWGFLANGPLSFEPRFTFSYFTNGGAGHQLAFDPDVNVLYRMGQSTARKGLFLTGGLGLRILNQGGGGSTSETITQPSINGGLGTRIPMESNAWRVEGFLRYNFKNTGKGVPSSYDIGARFGMSFWK